MINFRNINLKFNGKEIFHDFNLSIPKGSKSALMGRSGKGKTTILNMIMGFNRPDKGEILFDGSIVNDKNIRIIRKKIAYLPQNANIIGRGNVRDQILLPFQFALNKELKPDDKSLGSDLEKLNLDLSVLDSNFDEISGGEKQRIGLLIAKLLKRDVMLLDEPTSALDKENLDSAISFLCENNNATILSASHDSDWLEHCDNIIEL